MYSRIIIMFALFSLLVSEFSVYASLTPNGQDDNLPVKSVAKADKSHPVAWDFATKEDTDRIFSMESPSAEDLENIFCAVHVTSINPAVRNFVLVPGAIYHPFGLGNRFVRPNEDSFRPFIYFTLGMVVQDHDNGTWSNKKYAIITHFSHLVARALNISPKDTAVLGEIDLKMFPGSVVFMPEREASDIACMPAGIKLVSYDEKRGILPTVQEYLNARQHLSMQESSGAFSYGHKILVNSKDIYTPLFFSGILSKYPRASFGQEAAPKLARGMHSFYFLHTVVSSARKYYREQWRNGTLDRNSFSFTRALQLLPLVTCTELALRDTDRIISELYADAENSGNAVPLHQIKGARVVYEKHRTNVVNLLRTMKIDVKARMIFQMRLLDIGKFIEPSILDSYEDLDGNGALNWLDEETVISFLKEMSSKYSEAKLVIDPYTRTYPTKENGLFPFDTVLDLILLYPLEKVQTILKEGCFVPYELELRTAVVFIQAVRKIYGQTPLGESDSLGELKKCYMQLRSKYFDKSSGSKLYYNAQEYSRVINFNTRKRIAYMDSEHGSIGLVLLYKALSESLFSDDKHTDSQAQSIKLLLEKSGFKNVLVKFYEVGFVTSNLKTLRTFCVRDTLYKCLDSNGHHLFPDEVWKGSVSYTTLADTTDDPWE